jgi:hypothetical protein
MASCREKRRAKKQAATIRVPGESRLRWRLILRLRTLGVHAERRSLQAKASIPKLALVPPLTQEPQILAEDIGKLVDVGVDQRTVDYLYKAGFRLIRDLPDKGRAKIREIYGMKSRLSQVENVLQSFGVTLPA